MSGENRLAAQQAMRFMRPPAGMATYTAHGSRCRTVVLTAEGRARAVKAYPNGSWMLFSMIGSSIARRVAHARGRRSGAYPSQRRKMTQALWPPSPTELDIAMRTSV